MSKSFKQSNYCIWQQETVPFKMSKSFKQRIAVYYSKTHVLFGMSKSFKQSNYCIWQQETVPFRMSESFKQSKLLYITARHMCFSVCQNHLNRVITLYYIKTLCLSECQNHSNRVITVYYSKTHVLFRMSKSFKQRNYCILQQDTCAF